MKQALPVPSPPVGPVSPVSPVIASVSPPPALPPASEPTTEASGALAVRFYIKHVLRLRNVAVLGRYISKRSM